MEYGGKPGFALEKALIIYFPKLYSFKKVKHCCVCSGSDVGMTVCLSVYVCLYVFIYVYVVHPNFETFSLCVMKSLLKSHLKV